MVGPKIFAGCWDESFTVCVEIVVLAGVGVVVLYLVWNGLYNLLRHVAR